MWISLFAPGGEVELEFPGVTEDVVLRPCDLLLLLEGLLDRADPRGDVEQHDDNGNPGEDVFLPLGQPAENAMPSLLLREERGAWHGSGRFMRRARGTSPAS